MATQKESSSKKTSNTGSEQITVSVEPGAKVNITINVGETMIDGKVPLTVQVEQVADGYKQDEEETPQQISIPVDVPAAQESALLTSLPAWTSRLKVYDLATWLFILAVGVYLVTRLIGLTQFPIYFFTDEAIQSQSMVDLIANKYRDPSGVLLPTYFRNGEYYNIGMSVYLQWLPVILFGKSAVATRAMSVLVTLIAAVSVGILLRDVFKLKHWWLGTLFISITPAWFLHSRTAFETAEFVAFYAGTLCAYLLYRYKSARYLYLAVFLAALAFYSYSPAQLIVPLTALCLLVSDWRYHWENRRMLLPALVLVMILAMPYVRHSLNNPSAPFAHLHTLWSYWFEDISLSEKIARYLREFGTGLSAWYWYIPNDRDLPRHLMKDYGNIMIATLPFALLGAAHTLRNLHFPEYRAILISLLVSPAAAALVQVSITRTLVFVVPAAMLTAIGLEQFLGWVEAPRKRLVELGQRPGITPLRIAAAIAILVIGFALAWISRENINRLALSALAVLLALQVSGIFERLARSLTSTGDSTNPRLWNLPATTLVLSAFLVLSVVNFRMLNDALTNGPLWFRDYGMGGMQYGAFQIFDLLEEYLEEHPNTRVIFSPDWANGTDVVARFFLENPFSIQIGSVRGHVTQKLPLDDNTLFVLTPQDYDLVMNSEKLTDVRVERIIPYPDGSPGFYFVRLRYVDNIDEIFAAETADRQALRESTVTIDGQEVKLRYSFLDSDFQAESMALVFDNDPFTVAKTFEANPFLIEMTFPEPRTLNGFSIIIGSASVQITLRCYSEAGAEPMVYMFDGQGTRNQPELSFDLPEPAQVQVLQLEVLDPRAPAQSKVHIWELKLR